MKGHDFSVGFNTPEHKVKFSVGHNNVLPNLGFNVNARWQDEFLWQASSLLFFKIASQLCEAFIDVLEPFE